MEGKENRPLVVQSVSPSGTFKLKLTNLFIPILCTLVTIRDNV